MVDGLHAEVERHELANRSETRHRRADGDASETCFSDRGVYNTAPSPLLEQATRAFICSLVLAHFLPDKKHVLIALHFLVDGTRDGVTDNDLLRGKRTRGQKSAQRPRSTSQHYKKCESACSPFAIVIIFFLKLTHIRAAPAAALVRVRGASSACVRLCLPLPLQLRG